MPNGLYLYVQKTGARSWIQRLVIRGRKRELGLGSVALVSLAEAREQALANRKRAGWRSSAHARNWFRTLELHAFPRIRAVLEWAIAMDWRADNCSATATWYPPGSSQPRAPGTEPAGRCRPERSCSPRRPGSATRAAAVERIPRRVGGTPAPSAGIARFCPPHVPRFTLSEHPPRPTGLRKPTSPPYRFSSDAYHPPRQVKSPGSWTDHDTISEVAMEPALARMTSRGPRRRPFRIVLLCVVLAGCVAETPPPGASGPCASGDCRIELEHITRITDADDPGILPPTVVWLQETEAGTFVSASFDGTQIAEFGPDGRLAGVIGRAGQGPGELLRLRTVIPGPGDTLFAPDMGQGRITMFGPDRAPAGTLPMPFPPDLLMPDGSFLVASQIGRSETIGYPMHVVDREGRVVRSFGTDELQYRPDLDYILTRKVAPGQDGTVWAMAPARYILGALGPVYGRTATVDPDSVRLVP